MKKKQWIFGALACALCLGFGLGAGLLLAPRQSLGQAPLPVNPMATAEPDASASGADMPALGAAAPQASPEETQNVSLGAVSGIGGAGGDGMGAVAAQISSLMDTLAGLSADFSGLTAQAQAEAAKHGDWLSLLNNMSAARPSGKGKSSPVPSGLSDACAALGVTLACQPGGSLDMSGWLKAMEAVKSGLDDSRAKLQQFASALRSKYDQYERKIYELETKLQQQPSGQRVQYTDNSELMKTVIAWVDQEYSGND